MTDDTQPETVLLSKPSGASGEPPKPGQRVVTAAGESLASNETRQLLQAPLRMAAVARLIGGTAFGFRHRFR